MLKYIKITILDWKKSIEIVNVLLIIYNRSVKFLLGNHV